MSSRRTEVCKKQKKVCLSEAAAMRRVERFADIQRAYLCPHCGDWHITSRGSFFEEKESEPQEITMDMIKQRMEQIKRKLDENN